MVLLRYRHYESELFMTEAVFAYQLLLATVASVLLVMFGALYDLFDFAWVRMRRRPT